jgi:hypothetical protein
MSQCNLPTLIVAIHVITLGIVDPLGMFEIVVVK